MNGGTVGDRSDGDSTLFEVFLDKHLFPVLVHETLAVSDEEGHDEEDEDGHCVGKEDEGENCT